jgi:hypothetical protein
MNASPSNMPGSDAKSDRKLSTVLHELDGGGKAHISLNELIVALATLTRKPKVFRFKVVFHARATKSHVHV